MAKSIDVNANKRGRPKTTGTGRLVGVRLLPDLLAAVDAFRAAQAGDLTRSETVRLLVRRGLNAPITPEPVPADRAPESADLVRAAADRAEARSKGKTRTSTR
jgi:hypothetical protein